MTELTLEEQDLIIDKLIDKYLGGDKGCGNNLTINHSVFCMVTFVNPTIDYDVFSPNMLEEEASVDFVNCEAEVFSFTIQELQQKYFQDILTPTQNELIMFELTGGFEWPLQDKLLKKENKE